MIKLLLFTALPCVILSICPKLSAQDSPQTRQVINEYFAELKDSSRHTTSFEYEVITDHTDLLSGIRSIQALQKINGIYVLEGILSLNYGHYNRYHAIDHFTRANPTNRSSGISAEDAVRTALTYHGMDQGTPLLVKERSLKEDQ